MKAKKADYQYYVGLDIGTNSVGYAVTDQQYNIPKFHGEPAWGVTVFDEASLSDERRGYRSARRRLDRKQQRVELLQEIFADEVGKVDAGFFKRLQASFLFREDAGQPYSLFNDSDFNDQHYYKKYPTIHHLIVELMDNTDSHDVRLVYLACAWLVSHRGHFLNNTDRNNINAVRNFDTVYQGFCRFFEVNDLSLPWPVDIDLNAFSEALKQKAKNSEKTSRLKEVLFAGKKIEEQDEYPYSIGTIIKLLTGSVCKLADLFKKEEYSELGSISLGMDEDKFGEIMSEIGNDYDLIAVLRKLYDWSVLVDVLGGFDSISEAKVNVYNQHEKDLRALKKLIRKYRPEAFKEVFRIVNPNKDNYPAYVYHTDETNKKELKKKDIEAFSKYVKSVLQGVSPEEEDRALYEDILKRLELKRFLPKQKNTDNRVIPYQLYWAELDQLLKNAETYLPFLKAESDGYSASDKIRSIFMFKIPYFVGPLNNHSKYSWLVRKAEKVYPWNFEQVVDLDASEEAFIRKLTNTCTYLPGRPVLPKDSLCYHKFMVLNEINNIRINGDRIKPELKQCIYREVFLKKRKVTRKDIENYLISIGKLDKASKELLSGIDIQINSNLIPQIAFKRLLQDEVLTEEDAERIIERASYAEDKRRLSIWLEKNYSNISNEDRKYICSLKIQDFGRLSREFLTELEGVDPETGEVMSILSALWNSSYNLMELLAEDNPYCFRTRLTELRTEYYADHHFTLSQKLDEMYVSNAVKRPIYRTLAIMNDIEKAYGIPKRIFIEVTRGTLDDQKGKRTKSRKQQILDLYAQCKEEDVRNLKNQLDAMGEYADNRLQGDRLFLYYMQLGKCMYSGEPIVLEDLGTKKYDIDHIYPQARVKDDSILNNKVLVLSEINGAKGDRYPISSSIHEKMAGFWLHLKNTGLITEEKYKRLIRTSPFTEEELLDFINRQLTETSQSTKAVAELLKEKYPETEIVYCKAKLTTDFRTEFDLLKARAFNDLHHASDAYLNIVTGNVYHMRFSKKWFDVHSEYSVKTKTLFTRPQTVNGELIWDGDNMLQKVKKTALKNTAHFTKYAFYKRGGLFDQQIVRAGQGLTMIKKNLPTEKYGGYNKARIMFFIPTRYKAGKKEELYILSVELLYGKRFLEDIDFAKEYCISRLEKILGKKIDSVSFPLGMRPWKINTILFLDGFRICITGLSGDKLLVQNTIQLSADYEWVKYVKMLTAFIDKKRKNANYIYDEKFDHISSSKNTQLYDLYLEKMKNSIYQKRPRLPLDTVLSGRDRFANLGIFEQAETLMNLQQAFGRASGGIDLTHIGGCKNAAKTELNVAVSNWKKQYKEVHIIDSSASGLWQRQSENILELV